MSGGDSNVNSVGLDFNDRADLALINGFVYTVDERRSKAEAVAVKNGRITFVGSSEDAKAWIGHNTVVVDLKGRMLLPAFVEAHGHVTTATEAIYAVDMTGDHSLKGYQKAVEEFLKAHPTIRAIRGGGWRNTVFPPGGPRREDLDIINSDLPIALWSEDRHSVWANSKALQENKITRVAPDHSQGVIERDATGTPSGTLRESAAILFMDAFPPYSAEEYADGIRHYQKMAHALGYTACLDPWLNVGSDAITAYKKLAADGDLALWARGAYYADPELGLVQIEILKESSRSDAVSDLFQMNTVKFFADGVIEGKTAYILEPYEDEKEFRGKPLWEPEFLQRMFAGLEDAGLQIHVHAIGDAATKEALDALDYAEAQNGKKDYRNAITHLQLVDAQDFSRFKELGVIAVLNPYWAQRDDYYFNLQVPYLGQNRADREYPVASFFNAGVICAAASDYPVTNPLSPFFGIEVGVTRTLPDCLLPFLASTPEDPKFKEPLWLDERVSLEDMIAAFTYNGAYSMFLEKEIGSIEVGKSADMIVLDKDLFRIKPNEISTTKVLLTLFRGQVVHQDGVFKQ